jgi:hypothetical protein
MLGKVLISLTERTTLADLIKQLINNSFAIILYKGQRAYVLRKLPPHLLLQKRIKQGILKV